MALDWTFDWAIWGGLGCGILAGAASRFGRQCTMSAVEDGLVGGDWRGAKAWGLALASAILATEIACAAGLAAPSGSIYASPDLPVLGSLLGGVLFGLGMTLVGTCSFGLLVRAGGGDLRALMTAIVLGIAAISSIAGLLSPLREPFLGIGIAPLGPLGGSSIEGLAGALAGADAARTAPVIVAGILAAVAAFDPRLRRRWRLLGSAVGLGVAVAGGWIVTTAAVEALTLARPETLSFVAPLGRALLHVMLEPGRGLGFGVAAAIGVVAASFAVALLRREFRWDAFDDATEMRRHAIGAVLMAIGGVIAQGCTIGQGLGAGSVLAVSMPLFCAGLLVGARIGLTYLIEGHALWRLGRA